MEQQEEFYGGRISWSTLFTFPQSSENITVGKFKKQVLDKKEIIYIETSRNHRIKVHTVNGVEEFYDSLKNIYEKTKRFKYVSGSELVNVHKIESFNRKTGKIVLEDETVLLASRRRKKKLYAAYDQV